MAEVFLAAATLLWVAAAVSALFGRTIHRYLVPFAGAFAVFAAVLSFGHPFILRYLATPVGNLSLRLDGLGSFFVLLYGLVVLATSFYSPAYEASLPEEERRTMAVHSPLFQLSMLLVLIAGDLLTFFLAWEGMSLASYFLVMSRRQEGEVQRAGYVYLVMTHLATTGAFIGALLLAGKGIGFREMAAARAGLSGSERDLAFLLFLFGFGTKAAVLPWHVWLPRAHPVAPSPISALMSGVMIKLGIYALLRFVGFLGTPAPTWWGGLILALGVVSALAGVVYALMEHDLKRLLAYHSIENIGIILLGYGAYLLAQAGGHPLLAALALGAALYHTLNHAIFKSLLFLGAGSVQRATGIREMDRLGGLLKTMPVTGLTFLIGAAAISGLPPLNGFVSEWLTYQALLRLGHGGGFWVGLLALLATLGLVFTGALASACFVKAFGITFAGASRTPEAAGAVEVPIGMQLGPVILAVLSVGLGILPAVILPWLGDAGESLGLSHYTWPTGLSLGLGDGVRIFPLGVLTLLLFLTAVLLRLRGPERVREPWVSGTPYQPSQQPTTVSFSKPFRVLFAFFLRPERRLMVPADYFAGEVHYEARITPVFDRYLYQPVLGAALRLSAWAAPIQSGPLRLYLSYLLLTLILLLYLVRGKGGLF